MNLCLNAIDATEGVTKIEIIVSLVERDHDDVARLPGGAYLCIAVRDDGHGMDAAVRERIFDPFFSTKKTGNGLGLPTTKRIVEAHGGAIFVENILLAYFLGMCSFLAVSKRVDTAMGLGLAVTFVLGITAPANWALNEYLLNPGAGVFELLPDHLPLVGNLDEAAFLRRLELVREGMPGFTAAQVTTAGQAVTALEAYLADFGPVTARVTSEPAGLEVTYRPVYEDRSDADPGVTTDGAVTLRLPIDYWFDARDPRTGEVVSRRRQCQFGCAVHFAFPPPDTTRRP